MRKSFKQVLALVLCLCMCISLLPVPVLAEGNEDPSAVETELEPEEASVQSGDGGNEGDPDGPTYYTITFNATMSHFEDDGPTDDETRKIRSIQLEYGQSAGEIYYGILAEVDGYRFDGWCTDPECTDLLPDLDSWYPAGDATYYAKWTDLDTVDHYTVTLDAAGGHFPDGNPTVVFDVQKDSCLGDYLGKEDYIPEHDVPSFIWSGLWSEGVDGPAIEDADSYTVTGDVTLFAVWADAVQLIFDPNGGCFEDQTTAPKSYKAVRDQLFTSVPGVYHEDSDYVFLGWSFTADGSGDIVDVYNDFHPYEDMTLYALWEYTGSQQETYQITLYANGGFFPGASDEEHASQKVVDLPAGDELIGTFGISHEASNMVFSGWYYDEDCTEYAFSENESIQPTQSLELYAKWVYGYVVTFNAGSGYFDEEGNNTYVCAVVPGHTIPDDPGMSNLDESLDFWGWYLTPEFDGEQIYPYEYIPEGDVTLYARWVKTYTVTFNANGGYFANYENHDTVVVERISIYNSINGSWGAVHSDAHMAFTGWYFDESCTEPACVVGEEYYPDHDVTLYAGWVAGYLVTFNAGSGYFDEEGNNTYVCAVVPGHTIPDDPGMSNLDESLDFWGWYLTPEFDGEQIYPYEYIPEGDVTLYARWVKTYTVTFNANGGYFANYENHDTVVVERISIYNSINGSWNAVHSDAHMAFTGWYFDENCTEPACVVGEEYYPDHDVTLYAGWIAGYIVTFNAGSGYFSEDGITTYSCVVVPGHTIPDDPGISNLDESLVFFGWYLTPECDGEQIYPREYIPEDDVTLFAKWDRLHVDLENYQDRYTSLSYRQNGWYVWDNEMSLDIPVSAEEFAVVFCQNTNVHLFAAPAQDDPILSLIMQDAASLFKVDGFDFLFAGSLQLEFPADLIYSPGFWIDNPAADITITRHDNGTSNVHVGSGTLHYYGDIEELTLYSNGGSEDSSVTVYGNIHTVNWTSPDSEDQAYYGALYVQGSIENGYSRGDQVFDLTEEKIGVVSFDLATKSFSLEAAEELVCVLNDGALLIPYEDATITKDDLHYHYDGSLQEDGGISWYVAVYESRYGSNASCELPEDFTADDMVRRDTTVVSIYNGGYQNDAVLELTGDFGFVQLTAINARLSDGNVGELHVEGPYVRRNQTGYPYTTVTVDSLVSIVSMAGPMDHTTVTVGPNGSVENGSWRTYELGSLYNSSTRTFGSVGAGTTIMDRGALEIMSYDEGSDLGAIMPSSTVLSGAAGISGDNQAAFMYISGTGTDLSESEIAAVNSAVGSQEYGTTAAFDIDVYSVTFDDNGSVSDYSPVTELNSEVPIVLQTPIDEEADYCLVRLHEDENSLLSGETIGSASGDDGSITVNSDRFSKYVLVNRNGSSGTDDTYSVILDANGGYFDGDPACEEKQLDFAIDVNVANIPFGAEHSDAHMVFSGWYFDPSCTEPAATEEVEFYPSEDGVHLYAGWIRGYLVTFDANGGYIFEEDQNTITQTVLPGHTVDYNPGPSHPDESLAFLGWYLTPECAGEAVWPYEYVPEGDVTLYAGWRHTYTIKLDANGGYFGEEQDATYTIMVSQGSMIGGDFNIQNPDAHMAFIGWYLDPDCTQLAYSIEQTYLPEEDVTLYAGWEEGYIVTFDATGGKFDENDSSSISVTVRKNQTLDTNYQPYHENETLLFGGWYDQPNGEGNRIQPWNYVVKSDVTFYAKWNQTYQITFHANEEGAYFWKNGEKAPSNSIRFTAGSIIDGNVGAMNDNPARLLEGWYFDAECTRPAASRIMPYTVSEDIILYAKWEDSVIVTYEANDGDDATFPNGEKTLVKYSTPGDIVGWTVKPTNTNENKIFDGWNREQDGSGETVDTYSFIPEQNVTLYASWAQAWNVTFDGNGGLINSNNPASSYSVKVRDGNTVSSVLQNPVSAANVDQTQILDYWSYDRSGTSRADNPFGTPITGNITLYAQFAEGVAVHWISGGNSLYTQYVKKGSYLTSAPGHTWYWDSACTQSADVFNVQINEETTFYLTGSNQEDKITVTFDLDGGMFRSSPLSEPETELTVIVSKGQPVIDEMESIPYFIDAGLVRGYHKDGFSFAGWTSARGGTDDFDFTQSFDQDITVYAKWKPGFLLTLDGNDHLIYDGIFARSRTIELNIPADGTIMEALSRWDETIMSGNSARNESGKILEGWYYDKACTVPVEADDPAATVTVYAKWTVPYHITVDANGGFVYSPEGMYVVPGRPVKMIAYIEPGDDQYILIGWSLDRAGTQMIDDIDAFIPTGDTTIYAQWIKGSLVKFISEIPFSFGYCYFEKNVPAGESVGPVYLDEGCELMIEGWYLDSNLTRSIGALEDYVPTGSVTLFAKWGERIPVGEIQGLTLTAKSGTEISVSWTVFEGASRYELWAGTDEEELTLINTVSGTSAQHSGLTAGTEYFYQIIAKNENGIVLAVSPIRSAAAIAVPVIRSIESTADGVKLTWSASTGAAKYRVFRKTATTGWTKVADTANTSYVDATAVNGMTYTYTVRCISADGGTYTSNFDSTGKTITYSIGYATPVIGSIENTPDGVKLTWSVSTGAAKYRVFRKTATTGWTKVADTVNTSYVDTTAVNGTTYTYTVRCISADGSTYTSDFDSTGKTITYSISYATPVISSVENTSAGVKITWKASTGAAKYRVFRKTSTTGWTKVADTTSTGYVDGTVVSGTTYTYTVRCISADGNTYTSGFDSTGKSITYSAGFATPVIQSIVSTPDGVKLTWSTSSGAAKYRVFRKTATTGWAKVADTANTSYVDGTAVNGTTYTYTVRCISADGSTFTSDFDSVGKTITFTTIDTPIISSIASTGDGVKLVWNAPTGAVKYRVFRKTATTGWTKLADTASTSFIDAKAVNGETYTYTVRCINAAGTAYTSGFDSTGKTITFSIVATPEIAIIRNTGDGVQLIWNKCAGAEKYRVFRKTANGGWTKVADTVNTSFIDSKAVSGETYTYTVRCTNSTGTVYTSGFDSTGKTITCQIVATPQVTAAENRSNGIWITWSAPEGAEKYFVFRKTNGGSWQKVAETVYTSYTDVNVASGSTYTYTVRCVSADGSVYTSKFDATGMTITRS